MRLAYICADPGVPVFGHRKGCSVHVQEVLRALSKRGSQLELFATSLGGNPPADLETVRVHHLPVPPDEERAVREQRALMANTDFFSALTRQGPFDAVYERYSLWSFAGMDYARSVGIPGLLEVNAPLIEEQAQHRGLVDRANAERVAEGVFRDATALLAVSEEIKAYLERYTGARGRVHVVPNGVDPNRFRPDLPPTCPDTLGSFTVGFVGSLKPWHGLPVLLKAFTMLHRQTPNVRLLLVGDGPERERLEADISAHRLETAVHFTGAVAPSEVPGLLTSMDVAVVPAPNESNFYFSPLKLYEYMAAGRPIVASRIGQIARLIHHGVNGLLCAPGDPVALAAAFEQIQQDPALCTRLGYGARSSVVQGHTWDAIAQRILKLTHPQTGPQQRLAEGYA